MAMRGTPSGKVQRHFQGFTTVLASAVFEWFLIFLLFIQAVYSYLVTKFSCYCELRIPCLLCSRLDHVLGDEKPGFYRDLICGDHKLEISSLVLCHIHDKLADVHGMCESCLFSFATENKSNSETYRLLVGKLGMDLECCDDQDLPINDPTSNSLSTRPCSCCNKPWTTKSYAHRLLQTKSIAKPDDPSLGSVVHSHLHYRDGLKKKREKPSGLVMASHLGNRGCDPLSHIGYTELKITSDTESEVPFSDDDDGSTLVRETDDLNEDFLLQRVQVEPRTSSPEILPKTRSDDLTPEKTHQASIIEPSILVPHMQLDVDEAHDMTSSVPSVAIGHGLEELNWHQVEQRANPSASCELISHDEVPTSTNGVANPVEVLGENLDVTGNSDIGNTSITKSGEVCKVDSALITTTGLDLKTERVLNGPSPLIPNYMDLSDAYKLAVGNKGSQASGMLTKQLSGKDSARVNEDLKLLLSQISAVRGLELSLNDMSPKVQGSGDELKISDASSSIGMQLLQKRISIERNESGLESLDESIVSEIEGESVVDRLKRQVEYDRKSMSALYKELEEERNASTIAANQALAMITRLQEEKSALHMEALQYLRMMEEQAEYDVEALQKANDLLSEREKEIQDLEAELEFYRNKFPYESMVEKIQEPICDLKGEDVRVENLNVSCTENIANIPCRSLFTKKSEGNDEPEGTNDIYIAKDSLLDYEEERLYISQCLKKLEEKLHLFSNKSLHVDMSNGGYSGKDAHGINELEGIHHSETTQEDSQMVNDALSVQKDPSLSRGNLPSQERRISPVGDPLFVSKENHHFDCSGQDSIAGRESGLVALANEVSDLNDRLEALEADRNFLEHIVNSFQNGDEGLKFIQEIADHLQELRRVEIRRREQAVA